MTGPVSRRDLLRGAGGVAALGLLAACGSGGTSAVAPRAAAASAGTAARLPVTSKEVVWADYGGVTRDARKKVFFDPFEREYGVSVRIADASLTKFLAGAKEGTATYDSIDLTGYNLFPLIAGKQAQRLPDAVRRCDLIKPSSVQDFTGGGYSYSYGLTFKPADFKGAGPQTAADFFDLAKFPGKRSMSKSVPAATAELALLADGVPADRLYPLDLERAFAKLATIKGDILFYEQYAQGSQFLAQGAVSILHTANGRALDIKRKGLDVTFQWNDAVLFPWSAAPVPVGAPHADAMFALLDFMDDPQRQADFARELGYGPTTAKALDLLDETALADLPNSPEHLKVAAVVDLQQLGMQSDAYNKAFANFVGGAS